MFDLIAGNTRHIPSHSAVPLIVSWSIESTALALVLAVPVLFVTDHVPELPTMMAFVAAAPAPPPPPPAPAPPAESRPAATSKAVPAVDPAAAPIEAPATIAPEPAAAAAVDYGVPGGVEGGVVGGIPGGVVGGVFAEAPPLPPPPPAPVQRTPVHVGGNIQAPALLRRVEPVYPFLATNAHITGVVILEATVSEEGRVDDLRLLRSAHPLLDREAMIAVKQWRYSPLLLNGRTVPFILTVTLSFSLTNAAG